MNTNRARLIGVVTGVVLAGGGIFAAAQAASPEAGVTTTATSADSTLTADLQFAREEERLARDLYRALADEYDGALPFSRITLSEQRHFDALGTLLDRYDIADPADGKEAGSYADATLQELYDGWLDDGLVSLEDAYDVGIALEKRDIADLEDVLDQNLPADVEQVYTALLSGSRKHLAAFQSAADAETPGLQGGRGSENARGSGMGHRMGMGAKDGSGAGGSHGNRAGSSGDCPLGDAN